MGQIKRCTRIKLGDYTEEGFYEPNSTELYNRLDIYETDDYNTGILDQYGNPLYREREKIGFLK